VTAWFATFSSIRSCSRGTGLALLLVTIVFVVGPASARDDGRYANSPLKQWFDNLKSEKGLCCSDADGNVVKDSDWETRDGQYRVMIEGEWHDVPRDAVITAPNLYGRTMVWPVKGLGRGSHSLLYAGSNGLEDMSGLSSYSERE
jgi:hypothetical protein